MVIVLILWAVGIAITLRSIYRWDELSKRKSGFVFSDSAGLLPAAVGLCFFPIIGFLVAVAYALYLERDFRQFKAWR